MTNHAKLQMEEGDKKGRKGEEGEKDPPPLQIDPKWYARYLPHLNNIPFTIRSFQDALRTFFLPITNDDARLDFYTMYKREATEYDTDYVKKYDEDLNTTLIFVSLVPFALANDLTCRCRRVFSLPSVPPSSSTSTRASNPIPANNPLLSSVQSSSPSINPPSRTKPPLLHPPRKILSPGSSRPLRSYMRVL